MKPTMAIIFGINLNFSQPGEENLWAGVSQGTRGEKEGKLERKIRRKINVTQTRAY